MLKKTPAIIILCLCLLPFSSFAETNYDLLKLIGPRYEKNNKNMFTLEFGTGLFFDSEESNESIANPSINSKETTLLYNQLFMSYGIIDSIACHFGAPFIYIKNENSTMSEKSTAGFGDLSAGVTYQKFSNTGAMMIGLTYYNPTGESPYKIDFYNDSPTGSGTHAINPEIAYFHFAGNVVIHGRFDIEYSLPATSLSQVRVGPEGQYSVLNSVEPGINIGINLGYAIKITESLSANLGLTYRQYSKNKYKWRNGTRTTGDQFNTTYLYAGTAITIGEYKCFPELSIGTTDDSYDFGFSIRFPLL